MALLYTDNKVSKKETTAMDAHNVKKLENRVDELENLMWSIFRALETYITFNAQPPENRDCKDLGGYGGRTHENARERVSQ